MNSNALAVVEPERAALDVAGFCDNVERWAQTCDDVGQLHEGDARLGAVAAYLEQKSTEGRQRVAEARFRLRMRIGELSAARPAGRPADGNPLTRERISDDGIPRNDLTRFRSMAAHPDVVEQALAEGTDERPTTQNEILRRIAAAKLAEAEPERDVIDVRAEAAAIVDIGGDPDDAVESRRVPMAVPKATVGDGVPPHPATYPQAVMDLFGELIPANARVLDPFGGVGTIHELHGIDGIETHAIELEPEWAAAHRRTVCGDSRNARSLVIGPFDVIATSPAYGNRLADDYNAFDPHARRSYSIDLGRSVSDGSGAGLHFGTDGAYEALHREVWDVVVSMLRPGGLFLLNCKDFQRNGRIVPVTGWHVGILASLGMTAVDLRCLPAAGLAFTTAKPLSELVIVLRKAQP